MIMLKLKDWIIGSQISEFIHNTSSADNIIKFKLKNDGGLFNEMHFYSRYCTRTKLEEYKKLRKLSYLGIPELIDHGIHNEFRFIVIPKYNNIERDLNYNDYSQLVDSLEFIHNSGYSHADIKPLNIIRTVNSVILIDFETATKINHEDKSYDPSRVNIGTMRYLCLDSHEGSRVTARGDIESLGYLVNDKSLPWVDIDQNIYSQKKSYSSSITDYARSISYNGEVDYYHVKMIIKSEKSYN